jgi:hypothetical protein
MFGKIHKFMKEKPIVSILIILVLILIIYYIYKEYKKEHFEMDVGGSISVSSIFVIISVVQILVLYYVIKIANKNAILESSQRSQSKP